MKITVTYENGNIFQHFGHTEQFKIYDVENGQVTGSQAVSAMGGGHGEGHHCGEDKHGCAGNGSCH